MAGFIKKFGSAPIEVTNGFWDITAADGVVLGKIFYESGEYRWRLSMLVTMMSKNIYGKASTLEEAYSLIERALIDLGWQPINPKLIPLL